MTDLHFSPRPWSRRAEGLAVVGFWLSLGALTVVRELSREWGEPVHLGETVETFAEVGLWALLTPVVFWMVRRFPAERGRWATRFVGQLAVGVAVAFAIEYVTRGVLRPVLTGPLPDEWAWSVGTTFSRLRMLDELIIFFAVLATGYARAALFQVQERRAESDQLRAQTSRLEVQLADARLSALRMQLNPHFLFNSLNAVSALVERDPRGVRTLIARLSSLLRHVLETDEGVQEAPLRGEVAFVRDYLDVQRIRFQGGLRVEEAWAPDTLDALVPPLILQPLVENAVGHGVSRIEDGVGTVRLSSRREGDRLVLTVEDDGPGLDGDSPAGTGVGLANTRARLDALYGAEGALALVPVAPHGVRAEVSVPFRTAPHGAPVLPPRGDDGATQADVPRRRTEVGAPVAAEL